MSMARGSTSLSVFSTFFNSKVFDKPILLPEIFTSEILLSVIENEKPYIEYSASNSFFNILGFAFMGGIILNLMPCVFPVLGLKIMSFVKQAGEDSKKFECMAWFLLLG